MTNRFCPRVLVLMALCATVTCVAEEGEMLDLAKEHQDFRYSLFWLGWGDWDLYGIESDRKPVYYRAGQTETPDDGQKRLSKALEGTHPRGGVLVILKPKSVMGEQDKAKLIAAFDPVRTWMALYSAPEVSGIPTVSKLVWGLPSPTPPPPPKEPSQLPPSPK